MRYHMLLQMLFLTFVLMSNSALKSQSTRRLSECSDICGNITIPYPFGIEENCYLDKYYKVSCNTTTGRVSIANMSVDVVNITLEGNIHALSRVGRAYYTESGQHILDESLVRLSRFPLSVGQNTLVALGCYTDSEIKNKVEYKASCSTYRGYCLHNASCLGKINCCQSGKIEFKQLTSFRFHLQMHQSYITIKNNYTNSSYAIVVEDGRYNFSSVDVYDLSMEKLGSYEMVLDWTVGNTNCQEAQNDTRRYLCKERSECLDSDNAKGYRCRCSSGYRGNPYLENSCQDVNECEDNSLNDCTYQCRNTAGSYACHCPKGHIGDGRKGGTGCKRKGTDVEKLGLYIGTITGIIITSLTMFLSYYLLKQRRVAKTKETLFKRNGGTIFKRLLSECEGSTNIVKIFTEKELKKATNNFNPDNIIGQGGFGTVFKGILIDNTVVAIKKSKIIDPNQIEQFANEVVFLSKINHPNVVKLIGCCLETDVPLLAYEFVINETLHYHLHEKSCGSLLTWRLRLNIAVEVAGALAYMHSANKIIHRDIKSSNILLNDDYTIKISDFGISRSIPRDKTQVSTAVRGTLGYIDPEYFSTGILTQKSDVYSFGVLLAELLIGEKVNSPEAIKRNRSLGDHFVLSLTKDLLFEILDDQVKHGGRLDEINQVAQLVKSCLEREGKSRPTMQEVKDKLLVVQTNLGLA